MAFADKLKIYRTNLDLTQGELGKKIGVSQKTISAWEVGRSEPTMKELSRLCTLFDCTLSDLSDTRDRKVGEITMEDLQEKIRNLSLPELHDILEIVKQRIQEKEQLQQIIMEKEELEKQLIMMQARLKTYSEKIGGLRNDQD